MVSFRATAGNPLVPGAGLTDPHVTIYSNRAYMYATHDLFPKSKNFVMKDWWVWSSADLVNWKQVGTLKPEETFLHAPSDQCWAGFGASKHGNYYWYFSAGPRQIGVVEANTPTGPWSDPLGKPLIPAGLTTTEARDPDILMDDDGRAYMVYGTFHYFIVRLNDDMISLAETPRPLKLDREFGPYGAGKTDDKPSLHKRNGIYYLSWSSFYAMSTNVYGPYIYKGSVIAQENVVPEFQVNKAARGYDLWHDRHGNFFTWHHQWYYACNDKSQPGRSSHFRDCCLSYVHYRDNGEIAPIRLDQIGVGEYDAVQPRIESEDFFDLEQGEVRECPSGGFEVRGLSEGSRLVFPNIKNFPANARVTFRVACGHPGGGVIDIRKDDADGTLLGSCVIPDTGAWDKYQTISCKLKNPPGKNGICLLPRGTARELFRIDWFKITSPNIN